MHPASMVGLQSSFNHNLLAKPVPMRRLSDKRASHSRSSIETTPSEPPGMDPIQGSLLRYNNPSSSFWDFHPPV